MRKCNLENCTPFCNDPGCEWLEHKITATEIMTRISENQIQKEIELLVLNKNK